MTVLSVLFAQYVDHRSNYPLSDALSQCPMTRRGIEICALIVALLTLLAGIFKTEIRHWILSASASPTPITNPGPNPPSTTNPSRTDPPAPSPEPPPKQNIVDAPQAIEVGDFVMSMQECNRPLLWPEITKNGVRCDGSVENRKNRKIRLTISGGRIITDKRDEYNLSAGPYLFGQPGMFQLGGGCCSEELITDIPAPMKVWLHDFNRDATAINLILEFTSTGNPSQGEVVFKNIPVHGESL